MKLRWRTSHGDEEHGDVIMLMITAGTEHLRWWFDPCNKIKSLGLEVSRSA